MLVGTTSSWFYSSFFGKPFITSKTEVVPSSTLQQMGSPQFSRASGRGLRLQRTTNKSKPTLPQKKYSTPPPTFPEFRASKLPKSGTSLRVSVLFGAGRNSVCVGLFCVNWTACVHWAVEIHATYERCVPCIVPCLIYFTVCEHAVWSRP